MQGGSVEFAIDAVHLDEGRASDDVDPPDEPGGRVPVPDVFGRPGRRVRACGVGVDPVLRRVRGRESRIVLIDNGEGMTIDVVRHHWLNPATSIKVQKKRSDKPRTAGGRLVQGEKGIGRFAMFKLGSAIRMTTRSPSDPSETIVDLDISFLDTNEGVADSVQPIGDTSAPKAETAYLDELKASVLIKEPSTFDGVSADGGHFNHGTRIEISNLRGGWSTDELKSLHQDVIRLRPLAGLLTGQAGTDPLDFKVDFLVDDKEPEFLQDSEILINSLIERAVLRVIGGFEASTGVYRLTVNDEDRSVELNSHEMRGLRLFVKAFGSSSDEVNLACGDFSFEFLFFDLRRSAPSRFRLDGDEKDLIKEHRTYLYRDNIRVLPYGDAEDDWLQLDIIRGTQAASRVFSNDQTLGFVYITQKDNPGLRDKTNREGLIDSGRAFKDFVLGIQLLVTYLRRGDFARYLHEAEQRTEAEQRRQLGGLEAELSTLSAAVQSQPKLVARVGDLTRIYRVERDFMSQRVTRTEDLAGVGLSVETASHDVVATAGQALRDMRLLHEQIGNDLGRASSLFSQSGAIVESLSFIVSRLQDVQGLFVSSRQRPRDLNVVQFIRKVQSIYRRVLADEGIEIRYAGDDPLTVKTVDAALLQVFLNLMDNSVYWLKAARTAEPIIEVLVDREARTVTFSDNGPGVEPENAPYVFDAFFSAKGDQGRGLGLYIAREVARRNGFDLALLPKAQALLGGASFVLSMG